jgi:multidrug efflux pump subunit AcrB
MIDKNRLAASGVGYLDFVEQLMLYTAGPVARNVIMENGEYLTVKLFDSNMPKYDIWQLMNNRMQVDSTLLVPGEISEIKSNRVDGNIYRKDQSYFVTVAYDFIGPDELTRRVLERETTKMNHLLPLGYKAEIPDYSYLWKFGEKPLQYWLIGLIILIIWAISAIVFESLIQPLVVISMIPLSFIGTFSTFFYFDIPFDEGGYASLLLLSGLVVNMVIYILNDINHLRLQRKTNSCGLYLKAFNMKILPIVLTTLSTLLGLLPFMVIDSRTSFWTAFTAGTTGGLLFAIPVMILYLPLMVRMDANPLIKEKGRHNELSLNKD